MYEKIVHRTILITLLMLAYPAASFAGYFGLGTTVGFAPPPIPLYIQPPCPATGYIWTPGYWAYSVDDEDYYWVPGSWVLAPSFGLLWTPGYWSLADAAYLWHEGHWGPHVGFYGGINYGFGYFGSGFEGGYWRGHDFYYNRAVTNVSNVNFTNVYSRTVINNNFPGSRPSFNGRNGVETRPTRSDLQVGRELHSTPTPPQRLHAATARTLPSLLSSVNRGHPQLGATPRPGIFHSQDGTAPGPVNTALLRSSQPLPIDRGHAFGANRNTALYSPSANTHSQSPTMHARPYAVSTPSYPNRTVARQSGFGPSRGFTPAVASPASYAPPRASQAQAWNLAAHAPPAGPAFAQARHNAPAFHNDSPPAHVYHQGPAQPQRRS